MRSAKLLPRRHRRAAIGQFHIGIAFRERWSGLNREAWPPFIVTPSIKDIASNNPFVDLPPSPVNAVELFAGEWASHFPTGFPEFKGGGSAGLFEDPRIHWANDQLRALGSGFAEAEVLELGPLEGGHTYMFSQLGAREIVALEANGRAFLKCLVTKEVLGIERARFLLGNALPFLRENQRVFDVGVACAFLNHMLQPVEVIELLARSCRAVVLWNVVFSPALFEKQPALKPTFGPPQRSIWKGFEHTLHPHTYAEGLTTARSGVAWRLCAAGWKARTSSLRSRISGIPASPGQKTIMFSARLFLRSPCVDPARPAMLRG